jgi:hypothetical protein
LVERIGTKLTVVMGLVIVATSLGVLSTVDLGSGYGHVLITLMLLGIGMGTTMAPATESIMGSLPLGKAGVGSAVNDTTRQIGGALGVAVLGSLFSSTYASGVAEAVSKLPPALAARAGQQVGEVARIAGQIGGARGQSLIRAAHSAFIDGMGTAVLVAAGVALFGALISLVYLPARVAEPKVEPFPEAEPEYARS